jgi:hypothetical protein
MMIGSSGESEVAMYTMEAPAFHIWNEGDVHELVCYNRKDLQTRMAFGIRRCTNKDCDWCSDNRRLTVVEVRQP